MEKKKVIIFASGSGSNAARIISYSKSISAYEVVGVFSNNSSAGVLDVALRDNVRAFTFKKEELKDVSFLDLIMSFSPDLIVLAGFLLKIPVSLIAAFPNKIVNIHPALLPKYGGKGMYGMNIHRAVFENKEVNSGITIHLVNEAYDEGAILFQEKTDVSHCKSPEEIAGEILKLEHLHYPIVIEKKIKNEF